MASVNLGWVAKRWKTCFDLRAEFDFDQSERKSAQMPGQTE